LSSRIINQPTNQQVVYEKELDAIHMILNRSLKIVLKCIIALVLLCVLVFSGVIILFIYNTQSTKTSPPPPVNSKSDPPTIGPAPATPPAQTEEGEPKAEAPLPIAPPPEIEPASEGTNRVIEADLHYLAARNLLIPVAGVIASQLSDTFDQGRSEGRQHQAIDIMAPQGTPVLATTDGVLIKLFQSDKGGITLYQRDQSGPYVYYYAHLMGYANGIVEGKQLRRGDVIAYVGDTGNAGAGNFHLHFAISKLTSPGKWSGGEPINPYPLLVGK
jgi:peptidoglycan LD-endopeptidase LytH